MALPRVCEPVQGLGGGRDRAGLAGERGATGDRARATPPQAMPETEGFPPRKVLEREKDAEERAVASERSDEEQIDVKRGEDVELDLDALAGLPDAARGRNRVRFSAVGSTVPPRTDL